MYDRPFRWWVQSVMPLVFDDSLSYYEVLAKLTKYIEGLTGDVDQIEKVLETIEGIEDITQFTEMLESIKNEIGNLDNLSTESKTDLVSAINEVALKADIAYYKPPTGIPESDLSQEVQDKLNKTAKATKYIINNKELKVAPSNNSTSDLGLGTYTVPTGGIPWDTLSQDVQDRINAGGGGTGGTSDYTDLSNKPQINGHTLNAGNNTTESLGLGTYSKPSAGIPEDDLSAEVQEKLNTSGGIADNQESFVASRDYEAGELVYINGILYKVKTNILSGTTMVPGNNIAVTDISAELEKINSDINALQSGAGIDSWNLVNRDVIIQNSINWTRVFNGINAIGGENYLFKIAPKDGEQYNKCPYAFQIVKNDGTVVLTQNVTVNTQYSNEYRYTFTPGETGEYYVQMKSANSMSDPYHYTFTIEYTQSQGISELWAQVNKANQLKPRVAAVETLVNQQQGELENLEGIPERVESLETDVDELKNTVNEFPIELGYTRTAQLFDRSAIQTGYINPATGSKSSNTSYVYTEKIDVSEHEGDTIYFSIRGVAATARYVAAYDENSIVPESGVTTASDTYTVPAGIKEIIISYYNPVGSGHNNYAYFQAEFNEITPFMEYSFTPSETLISTILGDIPDRVTALEDEAEDVSTDVTKLESKVESMPDELGYYKTSQLFNRANIHTGFVNPTTGGISSNTSYVYTDEIDVSEHNSETIYFSIRGEAAEARYVAAYDNNGIVPSAGITASTYSYTVPSGITHLIISYYNPTSGGHNNYRFFQAEYNQITPFAEYGYFPTNEFSEQYNELYGKKWCVFGDSFSYGSGPIDPITSGRYYGKRKVYPYLIGNRNNMEIVDFFHGGETLATPADGQFTNHAITNPTDSDYYQNVPEDVDYITFYIGINDEHHATGGGDDEDPTGYIPLGTIDDDTINSFGGAWNVVLSWIIANRPNAHLGIIVTNGLSIVGYRDLTIAVAQKYGIPYIDLNGDQLTRAMIRTVNPNIPASVKQQLRLNWAVDPSSNNHPNTAAHEYESKMIEAFLRRI